LSYGRLTDADICQHRTKQKSWREF